MKRLTTIRAQRLADSGAEEVRRNHSQAIAEIQDLVERDIINDVVLVNGVYTRVPHGLGRPPRMVVVSPIFDGSSSAGRILEGRSGVVIDRAKAIFLYATGFTTTITVDVMVL